MIFQEKADSESYIKYLRQKVIKIVERTPAPTPLLLNTLPHLLHRKIPL